MLESKGREAITQRIARESNKLRAKGEGEERTHNLNMHAAMTVNDAVECAKLNSLLNAREKQRSLLREETSCKVIDNVRLSRVTCVK